MPDINALLREASLKGASDIHIAVGLSPRFRINGELKPSDFHRLSQSDTLEILLGLMNPEQRETFEKQGDIDISVSAQNIGRIRVNAYKQRGLISIAMRLVDMEIPDSRSLMIPDNVMDLCNERRGLILVTGPAGSGKSTVTASLIDRINASRACNIITLENPIEYIHEPKLSLVSQREIGIDAPDFLSAMNSALRQDPDVIVTTGLMNEEDAELILMAAETGRLVLSTLYSMTAPETVETFIDLFPESRKKQAARRLAGILLATVSRQLIPSSDGSLAPAYEVLIVDNALRKMIREYRYSDISSYMEENRDAGLITMDRSVFDLFKKGIISREEALKNATDREEMLKLLGDFCAGN